MVDTVTNDGKHSRKPGRPAADGPAATASATSDSPLDYMLRVMRDPKVAAARRDSMAKAALPYLHSRRKSNGGTMFDPEGGAITFTWKPPEDL
jgi:hypothetical protein